MELLLGCGGSRVKKLTFAGRSEWVDLVTVDHEMRHSPDLLWDLNQLPLPFEDDSCDEIHAYEVLEHLGKQGDAKAFFDLFSEFWRLLKSGGVLLGSVPLPGSPWAWGDPSHTRVIPKESFIFLNQPAYEQVGISPMSDFRSIYEADFDIVHQEETGDLLYFGLQAVKPSRIKR